MSDNYETAAIAHTGVALLSFCKQASDAIDTPYDVMYYAYIYREKYHKRSFGKGKRLFECFNLLRFGRGQPQSLSHDVLPNR